MMKMWLTMPSGKDEATEFEKNGCIVLIVFENVYVQIFAEIGTCGVAKALVTVKMWPTMRCSTGNHKVGKHWNFPLGKAIGIIGNIQEKGTKKVCTIQGSIRYVVKSVKFAHLPLCQIGAESLAAIGLVKGGPFWPLRQPSLPATIARDRRRKSKIGDFVHGEKSMSFRLIYSLVGVVRLNLSINSPECKSDSLTMGKVSFRGIAKNFDWKVKNRGICSSGAKRDASFELSMTTNSSSYVDFKIWTGPRHALYTL